MTAGFTTLAVFTALAGLLGLPTGAGSTQFASFLLSLRQFGFQPVHNSTSLGGSFYGSLSHHTITHTQKKITETKEILFEPKRAVELVTNLLQTVCRNLLGSLIGLHRLPEGGELTQLLQLLLSLRSQTPPSLPSRGRLAASLKTTSPIWITIMFTVRLRELLADIAPRSPSNTQNSHIEKTIKTKRKRFDFIYQFPWKNLFKGSFVRRCSIFFTRVALRLAVAFL